MAYIDQQDILNATNGGLDIILSYYPQVQSILDGKTKQVKIREERTASTGIYKAADGNWLVTDFGDDQVRRNGIQICQKEEEISFREAIVLLAGRYNIGGLSPEINKAGFEKRPAKKSEKEGGYSFEMKDKLTEKELRELGPNVSQEVCDRYYLHSLVSFTQIKNREALTWRSTDNYPIFLIDHETWKKIYQPKNPDKQYRFRYVGEKPKDFVNGLEQLIKANKDFEKQQTDDIQQEDGEGKIRKYPEAIWCSGDSDALNLASLGYYPLWGNSETAILKPKDYKTIMQNCEILYNLPDIDDTGIRSAIKLGMKYLDINTVWLPEKLREFKDMRGNPRKDFKDYIEIYPYREDLNKLLKVAKPMRFWDEEYHDKGIKYYFNNEHAYHFLSCNGFYLFENRNLKEGYMLIRIRDNIVSTIQAKDVKAFIRTFLQERYMPIPLRNMVYKTNQLNDTSLEHLPSIKIDFTDYDKHSQYLFFRNRTWKVTGSRIEEFKPGEITKYVWEEELIDHKVKLLKEPFKITWDKDLKQYNITILDDSSLFFRFLINSSRIHWRKELEDRINEKKPDDREVYLKENRFTIDGSLLNDDEIEEQKLHLVNKIFSLGYLLHRYKDPARPWCVFAMDNHIGETGMSFGRTGKSICYRTPRFFMKSIMLPGRNQKLTDNPHIYDRVTEHTDYILIDDADQYLNFNFFFEPLTGPLVVNPKNNQSYEIPFEDVPKFCITSNYTLRNIDPSTEGRILYTVFSDYYHVRGDDTNYREDRSVNDDFRKNLFLDYNEEEWNLDFNFFAYCLKFFLSVPSPGKINPPLDNVTKRNLKTEMGEIFENWADVYFSEESGNIDKLVSKSEALRDFIESTNQHKWTTQKFSKSLKAWCRYQSYTFDPEALRNSNGRIIRKSNEKTTEMIYIQTRTDIVPEESTGEQNSYFNEPKEDEEKAF